MAKQAIRIIVYAEHDDDLDSLIALKTKVAEVEKAFGKDNVTTEAARVKRDG